MDNPFIVKLHYAFQTHHKLYLIVDLLAGVRINFIEGVAILFTAKKQKISRIRRQILCS